MRSPGSKGNAQACVCYACAPGAYPACREKQATPDMRINGG